MKSPKLPRKRKKQYVKDNTSLGYMSARIVAEMCLSGEIDYNKALNPNKFEKDIETYPNGLLKKVKSYY